MAAVEYPLQNDVSKEGKDLDNSKSQMKFEESKSLTPEIEPLNIAVSVTDTDSVNDSKMNSSVTSVTEKNDADEVSEPIALSNIDNGVLISDGKHHKSDNIEKKLIVTEVTSHPLQISNDDETISVGKQNEVEDTADKKNRRVFFPEDGRIVSGYMDPPSPWNDASTCSTEELIEAYKNACERFGVKPLPRLMQQLNVINDFSDRNETLTLRGERLDPKHCETLEEILRRVQFRTVDLENTHLDDEGTVALFDMIEHYESCHCLNISNNRTIGVRGWQACARLMKKTPCLETLEAKNCVISEQVMPFFCRSLKMGSCLTVLHLENSIMSGRHLIIITQALKMNDILQELYLADNKLLPSDGIQLGNLLRYNFKLQLLDVRNNHLQDVGTSHICDGIWEQNLGKGLATIVLWNNQVTFQAMNSLSRALANTTSLETLNLGHNNITNEGIHRLKDGLLHNKSLLRIGLQASKISCEGAVALAEFIAESPRLRRIDLRENEIKTGGLMGLSLSLKVSKSVTRIDLDKEPKRETSMRDYAEQQQRLLNDINNYMQRNRDLARQHEEKERQKLLEQEEAEKKQAEQAAKTSQPLTDDAPSKSEECDQDEKVCSSVEGVVLKNEGENMLEVIDQSSPQRPLNLDLAGITGSRTLDSPAFLSEDTLNQFSTSSHFERPSAFMQPITSSEDVPLFFPPSPMISENGRPTLAPVLGESAFLITPESPPLITPLFTPLLQSSKSESKPNNLRVNIPKEVYRKSPSSSPTFKRKFVISRVQEPSAQLKTSNYSLDTEPLDTGSSGPGIYPVINVLTQAISEVTCQGDELTDKVDIPEDRQVISSLCDQSAVPHVASDSITDNTGIVAGMRTDPSPGTDTDSASPPSPHPAVLTTDDSSKPSGDEPLSIVNTQSNDVPHDETADSSKTQTLNQSAESTVNQSTESTVNQSNESTVNQSTESTVNQSTESTVNQSDESTVNQSTESTVNQSDESTVNQSNESTVNQSNESTVNQSDESTVNQSTESTVNQSTESTVNLSTESTVNQSDESTVNQSDESTVYQSTESTVNQSNESTVQGCVVADNSVLCERVDNPTVEVSSGQTDSPVESEHSSLTALTSHIDREFVKGAAEISSMNGIVQSMNDIIQEEVDMADLDQELSNIPVQDSECTGPDEFEKELDSLLAEVTGPVAS